MTNPNGSDADADSPGDSGLDYTFVFNDVRTIEVDVVAAGIGATVVPVIYRRNRVDVSIEGTAFCVGASPNSTESLYVTARHVVECLDPVDVAIQPRVLIHGNEIQSDGVAPRHLHAVPITRVVMAENFCDVALVVVDRRGTAVNQTVPKPLQISCAEPIVGDHCMALGYPQLVGDLRYNLLGCRGPIEEVHADKRDSSFITYPSFRVESEYQPSMSGGPIVTDDGSVIGVVSTGVETGDDPPIGYGACLASILELRVSLLDGDKVRREFSVPDLMNDGYIPRTTANAEMIRSELGVKLRWL
jgi:hypothetical protein